MYLIPTSAEEKLPTYAEEKFASFGELFRKLLSDGAASHKIKRILAVSAYYDRPSIDQLIELIDHIKGQKSELVIVIGTITKGELEALQETQKTKFGNEYKKGSGIRVITNRDRLFHGLFHSKGYLVETANKNGICAIGSMNLTQAGLNSNEEILTYSRYTHYQNDSPLVASFEEYVKDWCSDKRSKEIGAVSEKEPGIRWMTKGWNKSAQGNDYSEWLPPDFPDITDESTVKPGSAVKRYFKKLGLPGLNDSNLVNEREFTLALYKLIFQECAKNPGEDEREGVAFQYRDALWRNGFQYYLATWHKKVGNKMQHRTCSARFDVTLKDKKLTCYIFVYPCPYRPLDFLDSIRLGVCVGNKQNIVLQLKVSKQGWENIWNDKGQYWDIYSDGSMGKGETEECLSAVKNEKLEDWIKKPHWSKKELVYLGKLPVAGKVTWRNSRKFLARLLHYAIIRADIKFRRAK